MSARAVKGIPCVEEQREGEETSHRLGCGLGGEWVSASVFLHHQPSSSLDGVVLLPAEVHVEISLDPLQEFQVVEGFRLDKLVHLDVLQAWMSGGSPASLLQPLTFAMFFLSKTVWRTL
eukprot:306151-Hanusia_phi.AAC.4